MPFARPTLSQLRTQVAQDIAGDLPGADPLLRFSNLKITGDAQAGLAHLHYAYLDWIAKQAVPFTCSDEFLDAWAALKKVFRLAPSQASGQVTFSGIAGTLIPAGTPLVRGDGMAYTSSVDATVPVGGSVVVSATAVADPAGLVGANGNCAIGTVIMLARAISGVQSNGTVTTAFVGGADLETNDSLHTRMLAAYQAPPQGGNWSDYIEWARAVPGITRAWVAPNSYGDGSVVVYVMLDVSEAAFNGFPQGANGVSQHDFGPGGSPRAAVATGDQLLVADALYQKQPVTPVVYIVAPLQNAVNFTISGLSGASAAIKSAIAAAISGVFLQYGSVGGALDASGNTGGTVDLSYLESAIAAIPGTAGFVITTPTGNITSTTGHLPVLGTITWI